MRIVHSDISLDIFFDHLCVHLYRIHAAESRFRV